jgi:hypothetical protein
MDKVRGKFARLESLREVGLENHLIKTAGNPGEIGSTSPSKLITLRKESYLNNFRQLDIRRLDLSRNLLSSWEEVVKISEELKNLESLTLQ